MTYQILEGDCSSVLATLEPQSVQTCVTSPPYWGLRDYGNGEQLGLEPTPEEYVANLVAVFREVKRVLRDDGTLWLNLGDSYAGAMCGLKDGSGSSDSGVGRGAAPKVNRLAKGLKPKDLVGIPWMVAFALRADGWYLRSDIIWAKPNPMPESVTDRPTKAHEYLFLLTKSPRYFYDADAIREELSAISQSQIKLASRDGVAEGQRPKGYEGRGEGDVLLRRENAGSRGAAMNPNGANKRSVWTVSTQPFPGAHFATFPPKLIEPCILAGSPPKCCGECGAPWERVVEVTREERTNGGRSERRADLEESRLSNTSMLRTNAVPSSKTIGWEATCKHDDDSGTPLVLDPFAGAGTTGVVALRHNRSFIGIELNPEYAQMARNRIYDDGPLLNVEVG